MDGPSKKLSALLWEKSGGVYTVGVSGGVKMKTLACSASGYWLLLDLLKAVKNKHSVWEGLSAVCVMLGASLELNFQMQNSAQGIERGLDTEG